MADGFEIPSRLWATFLPSDPPRRSRIALWDPHNVDGLLDQSLEPIDVAMVDGRVHTVGGRVLEVAEAIDELANLQRSAEVHDSVHALAITIRFALDLIARGRLLPWISSDGWDSWRVGPLESGDARYLERIVEATPTPVFCGAIGDSGPDPRVATPAVVVGQVLDAVADAMVRSPAAAVAAGTVVFADPEGMRVPHLRPWVTELVQPFAAGCRLVIRAIPPEDETDKSAPWLLELSLRSSKDPSVIIAADELWSNPAAAMAVLGEEAESEFLIGLRQASLISPLLANAMEEAAPSSVLIHHDDVSPFLDTVPDLATAGIDVRWPGQSGSATIERRVKVTTPAPDGDLPPVLGLESLLEVEWEVVLNGMTLTRTELDQLAAAKKPVVRIRGQWVVLDDDQRRRLAKPPPKPSVMGVLAAAAAEAADEAEFGAESVRDPAELQFADEPAEDDSGLVLRGGIARLAETFTGLRDPEPAREPAGLNATLRDYQRAGLGWLRALSSLGLGGILADDMGLGKTIQILALHAGIKGSTLVVCPTSVITNWEREAATFVPDATVVRYHGPARELPEDLGRDHIVLTTYGVVRADAGDLGERDWNLVVADEAQAIKNPNSRTAKAMKLLGGTTRVALTGTPVENKLLELWSIASWAMPGYLPGMSEFRRLFSTPIERDANASARRKLQLIVGPILLRRRKTDPGIAPELPPKLERDVVVPLTAEQASLYKAVADQALDDLRSADDEISRQGLVLKMLTSLKQITNHPAHFLKETQPLAGRSGKLDALAELLGTAADGGESTLVFTQYVQMGHLIVDYCAGQGFEIGFLHGGCSVKERQRLVDAFQAGELGSLVLSLKAGGTGLNLTAASHVIHFDRWWNPAVEDQATDRAYRIGQDKTVSVHRLVTAGTVEDRIATMLAQKRQLAESVLSGGEGWIGNLSNEELADLITLDETVMDLDF